MGTAVHQKRNSSMALEYNLEESAGKSKFETAEVELKLEKELEKITWDQASLFMRNLSQSIKLNFNFRKDQKLKNNLTF